MIEKLRKTNEELRSGIIKAIPYGIPQLNVPGVVPGLLSCITAATNVGKTPLAKYIWVFKPIEFAIEHKLDLKILYFALEENHDEFYWSLYSYLCYKHFGARYNINEFEGLYNKPISEDFLKQAEAHNIDELARQYMGYIHLYDTTYTTQSIMQQIMTHAHEDGVFYDSKGHSMSLTELFSAGPMGFQDYIVNNKDSFRLAIVDHISLLTPTNKQKDLRQAIGVFVDDYARKILAKRLSYFVGVVHQQVSYGEDVTYKKGKSLEPTKDKLADNKTVGRTYLEIISLFDPKVYESEDKKSYKGYTIRELSPFFRILSVLKARRNSKDNYLPMYFDGKVGHMQALPYYKDTDKMNSIINQITQYKLQKDG